MTLASTQSTHGSVGYRLGKLAIRLLLLAASLVGLALGVFEPESYNDVDATFGGIIGGIGAAILIALVVSFAQNWERMALAMGVALASTGALAVFIWTLVD